MGKYKTRRKRISLFKTAQLSQLAKPHIIRRHSQPSHYKYMPHTHGQYIQIRQCNSQNSCFEWMYQYHPYLIQTNYIPVQKHTYIRINVFIYICIYECLEENAYVQNMFYVCKHARSLLCLSCYTFSYVYTCMCMSISYEFHNKKPKTETEPVS